MLNPNFKRAIRPMQVWKTNYRDGKPEYYRLVLEVDDKSVTFKRLVPGTCGRLICRASHARFYHTSHFSH